MINFRPSPDLWEMKNGVYVPKTPPVVPVAAMPPQLSRQQKRAHMRQIKKVLDRRTPRGVRPLGLSSSANTAGVPLPPSSPPATNAAGATKTP